MYISTTDFIDGSRTLYPIGKISAASAWHAISAEGSGAQQREVALQQLILRAEDVDADAIIDVVYETDGVIPVDESRVKLRRVRAIGTAVRLGV